MTVTAHIEDRLSALDRAGIESRVPQQGAMCLLDAVLRWDKKTISAQARPIAATHPLLQGGRLPALAAIEYGAQACAVHGALCAGRARAQPGMIGKLSHVQIGLSELSVGQGPLLVTATQWGLDTGGALYDFAVAVGGQSVVAGRLLVVHLATGADAQAQTDGSAPLHPRPSEAPRP